jgi:acetyl esterase/lipase
MPKAAKAVPGVINGVRVEEITGWEDSSGKTLLYLHGGAYCMGSIATHRALACKVSRIARARGVVIEYRLAPEHPHPAALDDALAVYRGLVARGVDPKRLAVAGDSAGGGLALALLLALRDAQDPLPAAAYLMSPYTDLATSDKSLLFELKGVRHRVDYYLRYVSRMYAGGQDRTNPYISPLHGDFSGLCPFLIQTAEAEALRHDARGVVDKAREKGVDARLTLYSGTTHVLPAMAGRSDEGRRLFKEAGAFLREHLERGAEAPIDSVEGTP